MNLAFKPYLPEWLGIDETQIDGKLRCIKCLTLVCQLALV